MLSTFKSFDTDRMELDELIALKSYGEMLRQQYDELKVEEPDYIDIQLKALKRAITSKVHASKSARLRELKSRQESLKTSSERKRENSKEIAELEEQLAGIE